MEKTPNGTKRQMGKNVDWDKTSNSKKHRMEETPNGTKRRMEKNADLKNVVWKKCKKHLEKSAHVHVHVHVPVRVRVTWTWEDFSS
jgi:hypothetical protein